MAPWGFQSPDPKLNVATAFRAAFVVALPAVWSSSHPLNNAKRRRATGIRYRRKRDMEAADGSSSGFWFNSKGGRIGIQVVLALRIRNLIPLYTKMIVTSRRARAILVIVCFGFEWAGCAWMKQKPSGEQIVMPLQTGSTLHRRIMVPKKSDTTTTTSKKKESQSKKKSNADSKKKKTERAAPKSTSKPARDEAETKPEPTPKPKVSPAPERFR